MKNLSFENLKSNFKNKRVFITGHTGFKGAWLTLILVLVGAKVKGYSKKPLKNSLFEKLNLKKYIIHNSGDILNKEKLKKELLSFEPHYVFHLAAQAIVSESFIDPENTFKTNIIGGYNLLEIIRELKSIKALVFITSDKCYENKELIRGYKEDDELGGSDPYSASKASAEIIFSSMQRSFFFKKKYFGAATARAGNVIGGGDWSENRIVPDIINSIFNGKKFTLRNPYSTRPWQHVLEPISGYLKLAIYLTRNPDKFSSSWNFGPKNIQNKNVNELIKKFQKFHNKNIKFFINKNSSFKESNLLKLNCNKSNNILNWSPKWNFDKTIYYTYEWYRKYYLEENVMNFTKEQIYNYYEYE